MTRAGIRVAWFLLVGWWLGLLWLAGAFVCCLSIVGWPVGLGMAWKTPDILFLPE